MRASSRVLIAVTAIVLSLSCCNAAVLVERNVDSGHVDLKPKDTVQRIECFHHKFCEPWQNTTCAKDTDGKNRCLCSDQTHPINDNCIAPSAQELGMPCEQDDQCTEFTACVANDNNNVDVKTCQCKEEFNNDDGTCNDSSSGGVRTVISMYLAILTGIVLQLNRN